MTLTVQTISKSKFYSSLNISLIADQLVAIDQPWSCLRSQEILLSRTKSGSDRVVAIRSMHDRCLAARSCIIHVYTGRTIPCTRSPVDHQTPCTKRLGAAMCACLGWSPVPGLATCAFACALCWAMLVCRPCACRPVLVQFSLFFVLFWMELFHLFGFHSRTKFEAFL